MKYINLLSILVITISCTANKGNNKAIDALNSVTSNTDEVISKQKNTTELNGIYEYVYPYNSDDLIENHYIAFKTLGKEIEGWYYGTSDEFDEAREGYLPGYFVSSIKQLETTTDSIFFTIETGYNKCYDQSIPIGFVDAKQISAHNQAWDGSDDIEVVEYAGKLTEQAITITINGDTRVYTKRKNDFELGIDNLTD